MTPLSAGPESSSGPAGEGMPAASPPRFRNPVMLKELRGRMRGARAFVVLTVYLLLMGGFASLLYLAYAASAGAAPALGTPGGTLVGKVVFGGVVGIELFMVCFIAPAFTAGAVTAERERQTLDLLKTTLLLPGSLIRGKLGSALSYVVLLLLAALPLQSLAFLLGGVSLAEVLIATTILLVTALAFGSVGLFFSSLMRRTMGASVLTYAFALLATLGLPLLAIAFIPVIDLYFFSNPPPNMQVALVYFVGFLVAVNPIATAVVTEVVLVEEQTAFYFTVPLDNGLVVPLVSPWIVYVLFYLAVSVGLIIWSTRLVAKVES